MFKEPLLWFLLLGAGLFALFQQVSDEGFPNDGQLEEIVVTEGRIQALSLGFEKVWQRPPSQAELDALIENFVREEVLYREALAMGLDRDDPIVRRRMKQKIEFLSEDLAALEQPADTALQAYLTANRETYRRPSRYSFRQVYLNTTKRDQSVEAEALEMLSQLRSRDTDAAVQGDSIMIPRQFDLATERDIERVLGREFLQRLRQTPIDGWQGPIRSGYGLHLVHISKRVDGEIPKLDAVRDAVFRDWSAQKREQANTAFYDTLRKRYRVTVANSTTATISQVSMVTEAN
jgi:hypothetical protein